MSYEGWTRLSKLLLLVILSFCPQEVKGHENCVNIRHYPGKFFCTLITLKIGPTIASFVSFSISVLFSQSLECVK